jgi:hypothetical protein
MIYIDARSFRWWRVSSFIDECTVKPISGVRQRP